VADGPQTNLRHRHVGQAGEQRRGARAARMYAPAFRRQQEAIARFLGGRADERATDGSFRITPRRWCYLPQAGHCQDPARHSTPRSRWLAADQMAGMTGRSGLPSGGAGAAAGGSTEALASSGASVQALCSAAGMLSETLEELECRTDNIGFVSIMPVSRGRSPLHAGTSARCRLPMALPGVHPLPRLGDPQPKRRQSRSTPRVRPGRAPLATSGPSASRPPRLPVGPPPARLHTPPRSARCPRRRRKRAASPALVCARSGQH
jgi:hypothetical protein